MARPWSPSLLAPCHQATGSIASSRTQFLRPIASTFCSPGFPTRLTPHCRGRFLPLSLTPQRHTAPGSARDQLLFPDCVQPRDDRSPSNVSCVHLYSDDLHSALPPQPRAPAFTTHVTSPLARLRNIAHPVVSAPYLLLQTVSPTGSASQPTAAAAVQVLDPPVAKPPPPSTPSSLPYPDHPLIFRFYLEHFPESDSSAVPSCPGHPHL